MVEASLMINCLFMTSLRQMLQVHRLLRAWVLPTQGTNTALHGYGASCSPACTLAYGFQDLLEVVLV